MLPSTVNPSLKEHIERRYHRDGLRRHKNEEERRDEKRTMSVHSEGFKRARTAQCIRASVARHLRGDDAQQVHSWKVLGKVTWSHGEFVYVYRTQIKKRRCRMLDVICVRSRQRGFMTACNELTESQCEPLRQALRTESPAMFAVEV
jgi:hypothetical protein